MGTYLNHQATFIFSDNQSEWANRLPSKSAGWYSDESEYDSHDDWNGSTVSIKHGDAHPDYIKDYGVKISECGRAVKVQTGCYGSYNLGTWSIPNTLIAIVSQWDNTQCADCFVLKTVLAKDVPEFNWFPGTYKDEYVGPFINKLKPDHESLGIDTAQWSNNEWGIWAAMNEAAVMAHMPIDAALPINWLPLEQATLVSSNSIQQLFTPKLVRIDPDTEGYTFVLTGNVEGFKKEEAIELLKSHGAIVVDTVNEEVDAVLVGANPGSEAKTAKELELTTEDALEYLTKLQDFNKFDKN